MKSTTLQCWKSLQKDFVKMKEAALVQKRSITLLLPLHHLIQLCKGLLLEQFYTYIYTCSLNDHSFLGFTFQPKRCFLWRWITVYVCTACTTWKNKHTYLRFFSKYSNFLSHKKNDDVLDGVYNLFASCISLFHIALQNGFLLKCSTAHKLER